MKFDKLATVFRAIETYKVVRDTEYRDHSAEAVADALMALGWNTISTLPISNDAREILGARCELVAVTKVVPDRFDCDVAGTKRYLAMLVADALCDAVYPPIADPIPAAVASMRGGSDITADETPGAGAPCGECHERGWHKLDCGKRERMAPTSMNLVEGAAANEGRGAGVALEADELRF